MIDLKFVMPEESEHRFFYSDCTKPYVDACVGYLRMDFDSSGKGFYHTWFSKNDALNDRSFGEEFDAMIDTLRHDLLSGRSGMEDYNREHDGLPIDHCDVHGKGYQVDTEQYVYYLRCTPMRGDYDCYCYCYDK